MGVFEDFRKRRSYAGSKTLIERVYGGTLHASTDGLVIGNPGCGGWAAVMMSDDKSWEILGSSPWTTIP
jgi:hypothetical protein